MTRTTALITALSLTLVGGVALAGHGGHGGRHEARAFEALGLDDGQKAAIKELATARRAAMKPLRAEKKALRQRLQALWQTPAPDRAAILAVHAEMASLKAAMTETRVDFRLAVHGLLDDAQRAKFGEAFAKGHGRRGGKGFRHGRRGGKGGPGSFEGRGRRGAPDPSLDLETDE